MTSFLKKAWPLGRAFFFASLFLVQAAFADNCQLSLQDLKKLDQVTIKHVIDGDTVILASDERVRLIGINTPEKQQPLYEEAKLRLGEYLASKSAFLKTGEQKRDHYGRLLGHLYLEDGRNIEAEMLREGYGFLVAFPPNLELLPCHQKARNQARQEGRYVWGIYRPLQVHEVSEQTLGFQRIKGTLVSIEESRNSFWLHLDGDLVLRVQKANQAYFDWPRLRKQVGKAIEVSGWVVDRSTNRDKKFARYMLELKHQAHINF